MKNVDPLIIPQLEDFPYEALSQHSSVFVLVDQNTKAHCYPLLKPHLPHHILIETTAGEASKNLATCQHIWQILTDHAADRKAVLLHLGGGVIGDMGGFSAATYKRGIAFWHIPTTLLAQVDAAHGGKLGVDFHGYKNHIGLFKNPDQVLIWTGFLDTLPQREMRSGLAEMLKHALITDKHQWAKLTAQHWQQLDFQSLIPQSIQTKRTIIDQDPLEAGLRKTLNYGHTIGHAIETWSLLDTPQPLLHGEAVAVGIICETWLSHQLLGLPSTQLDQVTSAILTTYGHHTIEPSRYTQIADLALQDKKNESGQIKCVLLHQIGEPAIDQPITRDQIIESLAWYTTHQQSHTDSIL